MNKPIDPRVRLAISQWPDDAPRGAVSTFCTEHGISRKSFYVLRNRAKTDGPAAVLQPRTRGPKSGPSGLSDEVKEQALAVRAALKKSGLDHGPISVHDTMRMMGLEQVPSTASLAHIFREAGVARLEPPLMSWKATPKADAPRPNTDRPVYAVPADAPAGARIRTVTTSGTIGLDSVSYKVDVNLAFQQVLVIPTGTNTGDPIIITDFHGQVLAEHTRPAPGIRYVGNGRRPGTRPRNPEP